MDHIPSPDRPEAAKTRAGDTRDNPGPRLHALWVPRGTGAFGKPALAALAAVKTRVSGNNDSGQHP